MWGIVLIVGAIAVPVLLVAIAAGIVVFIHRKKQTEAALVAGRLESGSADREPSALGEDVSRVSCMQNLSQLAQLAVLESMTARSGKPRSGPARFLGWRLIDGDIKAGQESVLVCPGDHRASLPKDASARRAYESMDLEHAPREFCSYAGRDFELFPLQVEAREAQVIAACIHHTNAAVVAYESGDIQILTLADLGLTSDYDKMVGPDSKSPVLRVVRYGDGSVR